MEQLVETAIDSTTWRNDGPNISKLKDGRGHDGDGDGDGPGLLISEGASGRTLFCSSAISISSHIAHREEQRLGQHSAGIIHISYAEKDLERRRESGRRRRRRKRGHSLA